MHSPAETARRLYRLSSKEREKAAEARTDWRLGDARKHDQLAGSYDLAATETLIDNGVLVVKQGPC